MVTEPGEHTTIVSLYGGERGSDSFMWVVVTVEFAPIFQRACTDNDFYDWMPWEVVSILHHLLYTVHFTRTNNYYSMITLLTLVQKHKQTVLHRTCLKHIPIIANIAWRGIILYQTVYVSNYCRNQIMSTTYILLIYSQRETALWEVE